MSVPDDRAEEQRRIREKRDAEEARRRSLRDQRLCASCGAAVTDAAMALGLCPRCGKKLSVVLAPAQPALPLAIDPPRPYKAPEPPAAELAEPDEIPDPPEPACPSSSSDSSSPPASVSTPSAPAPTSPSPSSSASTPVSTPAKRGKRAPTAGEIAIAAAVSERFPERGGETLPSGYPDYGGPHPAMVVDVHKETRRPAPTGAAPEPRAAHAAERERRVTGYAVTKVVMTFHMGGGTFEDLAVGTVIELIDPSPRDQKDLDHWERVGRQHVVVRWRGGIALVLGKDISRTDIAAWRLQEEQRKATPC